MQDAVNEEQKKKVIRLAATADTHCRKDNIEQLRSLLVAADEQADVLLLCGDLTDSGLEAEARILASELSRGIKIPVIAVLGNHDHESDKQDKIKQILSAANVCVLDGNSCRIFGIGFAGVKGFGGGFGGHQLKAWGERVMKDFVRESEKEAELLEMSLSGLRSHVKIALMHYSPIASTLQGESCEIFPFMGSSLFEEVLDRNPVNYLFHGHAHSGSFEGRTAGDIPVFNVSMPLYQKKRSGSAPFHLIEVSVPEDR